MPTNSKSPVFSIYSVIKNVVSRERMFRRSIESVLNQTFSDFEYVIQDGGSTDKTAEIVAEYADPRIQFLSVPDSCGEEGFFRALKRCRGKYIGACLSDEELFPDALGNVYQVFEEHPDIAGFYGNVSYVDENGRKWGPRVPLHPFSIEAYVCQELVPPFCSSFFRREAIEKAGLHEHHWRYHIGEFEFWIRIAGVGEIIYLPLNVTYYGRHSQSSTRSAKIYDELVAERDRAMPDLFRENKILRDCNVTVEEAVAGNYVWGASSVLSIEGLSHRCEYFMQQAERYAPKSPQLAGLKRWIDKTVSIQSTGKACVSTSQKGPAMPPLGEFARWLETLSSMDNRLYYRDQSSETLASLYSLARDFNPTVLVELGTLGGLSLRTWIASAERASIYAVDLSFEKLHETMRFLPTDLARVTLLEQNILRTDFPSLWTAQDRVIFFVDAHDLPGVPIMEHVLTNVLPALPDGSLVIVDDLWFSEERLTHSHAEAFLKSRVVGEIDELQCFEGHYAPYHEGGSFMGFAEVIPLLKFANAHGIPLVHEEGGKHVSFVWRSAYLSRRRETASAEPVECYGSVLYNPLASVPTSPVVCDTMHRIATDYRQKKIGQAAESLAGLLEQYPHEQGLAYGLAVCLARVGKLAQARDILARVTQDFGDPCCRRLFDDLVERVGPCPSQRLAAPASRAQGPGVTIFAMPKPFDDHIATIQKNAIRSWARLDPAPEIILFGDEPGISEMAAEVGARHVPNVDRNEFGTPLVNKLFEAGEDHASHRIVAYVNADMILFQDFIEGVQKVQTQLPKFLLIGQRWDLPILDEIDFSQVDWQASLQREMQEHAMLHAECGLDYFIFPKGLYPKIPPFAIGRTAWDNWLVMAPHKYGVPVVDGTEFITAVHQDHDYGHMAGGRNEAWNGAEAARNRTLAEMTDNSGRASGATWVLCKDGVLAETQPRQPWYLTNVYRDQRSAWLFQQADRLISAGRTSLAKCKLEEALVLLEALLALKRLGYIHSESMDSADLARRYTMVCMRLAECYLRLEHHEQVVATYTRFLENSNVQILQAQRDDITRVRDRLVRLIHGRRQPVRVPAVPKRRAVESEAARTGSICLPKVSMSPTATPGLRAKATARTDTPNPQSQVLIELEQRYRSMPDGTRAKHAMAVRLSDLFRRAGLKEKSQTLEMEAAVLKKERNPLEASRPVGVMPEAEVPCLPKVTVITACRNSAPYLRECLDSILDQTMSEWELFLLDDGSTDDTRRIIQEYARRDTRVKACCFEDSAGPYIRRNYAIERAGTDFIVIQDADDIMSSDKLCRLYETIMQDDRLGIVGSFYRMFLDEFRGMEYTEETTLATTHEQILEIYQMQHVWDFSWHGSAIIRKSLFGEIGPYDENPFGADSFWLVKLIEYARFTGKVRLQNISEFLTLRRVHGDSQTGVLPTIDPRGKKARYRKYCECKLERIHARIQSGVHLDIGRELRQCTCSDFLTRFKAQIITWENEPLDGGIIAEFLQSTVKLFNQGYYVSCANILNGVEAFDADIPRRVIGYELLRGLAFFGVEMRERSLRHVEREIQLHDNPAARQFRQDAFEGSAPIDVQQWCQENAERYDLGLATAKGDEPPLSASCVVTAPKQGAGL